MVLSHTFALGASVYLYLNPIGFDGRRRCYVNAYPDPVSQPNARMIMDTICSMRGLNTSL